MVKLGWAYVLRFDGERASKAFTMNLEQAGEFGGRRVAQAKGKQMWRSLYVTLPPLQWERLPYEYF